MTEQKHSVVVQKWEESERGWGSRPDGYSLHKTESDRGAFVQKYWDSMQMDRVPEEYSRPSGTPYLADVDDVIFQSVIASENGKRFNGIPPGSGGTDGWVPRR